MSKKSLVKGAAVLAAAGIVVKLLGAVFRIPLANLIGTVGMANYSPAYSLYSFLLVFATTGLPVAISKMVSERYAIGQFREAERVFRLSRTLMTAIGVIGFCVLMFLAKPIAELINVPGSAMSMQATAPALLLVPLMASYRGYFQGMQEMRPTAVSQIVEQLFRVAFGLLLIIGGNMIKEAFSREEECADGSFGVRAMFPMAVATSIDALAVGVTFALLPQVNIGAAVLFIGATTFVLAGAGVKIGSVFGLRYKSKAELAGGIILILMGIKILFEHLGIINF